MVTIDLEKEGLRHLNARLQAQSLEPTDENWVITNPRGSHAIAVGLDALIHIAIVGSSVFYCVGLNV